MANDGGVIAPRLFEDIGQAWQTVEGAFAIDTLRHLDDRAVVPHEHARREVDLTEDQRADDVAEQGRLEKQVRDERCLSEKVIRIRRDFFPHGLAVYDCEPGYRRGIRSSRISDYAGNVFCHRGCITAGPSRIVRRSLQFVSLSPDSMGGADRATKFGAVGAAISMLFGDADRLLKNRRDQRPNRAAASTSEQPQFAVARPAPQESRHRSRVFAE